MSKHPLELPKDRILSKDELLDALRLSIIAELDAISLYLQLARASGDEKARKVFEDVAREEKTHVGEFLALLNRLDPEQARELERGLEEVEELVGGTVKEGVDGGGNANGNNPGWLETVLKAFRDAVEKARVLRRYLPTRSVGRGVEALTVEKIGVSGGVVEASGRVILPMEELSVKFRVGQREIDHAERMGEKLAPPAALYAASRLGYMEDKLLVDKLASCEEAEKITISDWSQPGAAVEEVAEALSLMVRNGVPGPYALLLSPGRYAKLVAVHERTGVMELTRLKQLVSEVVKLPQLPEDKALLVSLNPSMIDLAVGADTVVDYIGLEDGFHTFRAWETLALRIKYGKAIVVLSSS